MAVVDNHIDDTHLQHFLCAVNAAAGDQCFGTIHQCAAADGLHYVGSGSADDISSGGQHEFAYGYVAVSVELY